MKARIEFQNQVYTVDLSNPIDIGMPLEASVLNPTAWYCSPPRFEPVMTEHFVGDVNLGGAVNFRDIYFNPHGHGTHTECVGHISKEPYVIHECLKEFFMMAQLLSVEPMLSVDGDRVILPEQLPLKLEAGVKALIIRTLPNLESKLYRQYSNTNPPFLHPDAMRQIVALGIEHLLIDTPSVDREEDGGELLGHHIFWNYPQAPRLNCTISELIYVPNQVLDGHYFMQLQVASFVNDAAPSRPFLYKIL